MALKLTIGGIDFTSRWRPEQSRWTMRAHLVESVSSSFVLDDFAGDLDHAQIVPTKIIEVTEDASGSEVWLYRGRVTNKSLGRGPSRVNPAMRWTISADDANADLRGMRVVDLDLGEQAADVRVKAIRNRYLDGASSTSALARASTLIEDTYILATSPVVLPATEYQLSYPDAVLQEIAEDVGYQCFVYLETDGTLALYFGGYVDASVLASDVEINDDGSADGEDIFAPYYSPTTAEHAGQRVLTGGGIQYGDDGRYHEDSDIGGAESVYDKWEEHIVNEHVENDLQAARHLTNTVVLAVDQASYVATIDMRADQVHRLRAGMMVMLKQLASDKPSLGFQRASQVTVEPQYPDANGDAMYRLTAELGRPRARPADLRIRRRPLRFRTPGTDDGAAVHSVVGTNDDDSSQVIHIDVPSELEGRHLVVLAMLQGDEAIDQLEWRPAQQDASANSTGEQSFTLYRRYSTAANTALEVWELNDPTSNDDYAGPVGSVVVGTDASGFKVYSVVLLEGATGGANGFSEATGTSTTASADTTTTVGDLVLSVVGAQTAINHTWPTYTPGADQTELYEEHEGRGSGPGWFSSAVSREDASTTTTTSSWTLSQTTEWSILNVKFAGPTSGTQQSQPIGDTNDPGDAPHPSHDDHTHAHGYLPGTGPYHAAHGVTYDNTDTELDAGNVQDAIDELSLAVGGPGTWFNVQSSAYGAVGDGVNDDTAEIQAAIDACIAAGGGVVYFPTGTYNISAQLDVDPGSGLAVHLRGDGMLNSIIDQQTADTHGIVWTANAGGSYMTDLWVRGPGGNSSGFGIDSPSHLFLTRVRSTGYFTALRFGSSAFYAKVSDSMFEADSIGVDLVDGCNNTDFFGCYWFGGATGLYIRGCEKVAVYGGSIEGASSFGVRVDSGTNNTSGVTISGVYFENDASCTEIGVGTVNDTVKGVVISACKFTNGVTRHIDAQYVDGLVIEACHFRDTGATVRTQDPADNVVLISNVNDGTYTLNATTYEIPEDLGSGAAADISITDAGGYFTGTDVEAALQELGADVSAAVAGHYEVIVSGTAPPVAVTNIAEDDWLYGFVPD